ncbi:MAG TPA: hypothetical protein VH814_00520 [Steroidobacteraceae bacterium]|jgi:hypothetical protein
MSTPATAAILKGWVAEDAQPTAVMSPCFLDPVLEELRDWHPNDPNRDYSFMHLQGGTANDVYAHADRMSFSNAWNDEMKAVMLLLELRPFPSDRGTDAAVMLIDEGIGKLAPAILEWKVIRWMAVQDFDSQGNELHQDVITWQHVKDGTVAKSMFTWRPYKTLLLQPQPQPQPQASKGPAKNGRGIEGGAPAG